MTCGIPSEKNLNAAEIFTETNPTISEAKLLPSLSTQLQPTIHIDTAISDQQVTIRIADNGTGMTEAIRKNVFNPFFTTKPVGQGTGIGLSISYQIITERHQGTLRCFSRPHQGTEFVIEIPCGAL
jgi:signal transduction histidine kinase